MKVTNFILLLIFLVLVGNNMTQRIVAHVDDPHTEEADKSPSMSVQSFIFVNIVILSLSLSLVLLVNQYQHQIKLVSPKTMIIIIISTLFVNAIVAINTYVEVE